MVAEPAIPLKRGAIPVYLMRWRYFLPVLQISLALFLQGAGRNQEQHYLAARDAVVVSDYVPPATQAANIINFPALVASAPVGFWAKPESLVYRAWFLVCVGLLWFFLGARLDARFGPIRGAQPVERSRGRYRVALLGVCVCVLCAFYSIRIATFYPVMGLGGLVWAIALAVALTLRFRATYSRAR